RLELGGRPYEIARLKRDKNSLVDASDRPLDEAILTAELGGADRETFHMMFSIDDESLERGGEAILASHGDLGQLLFSASAGLAEISGRLESLRKKADEFYRPRASTSELAELKRELDALSHERKEADTLAPAYAELVRQRDAARDEYAAAAKSLSERRAREDEIQRQLGALSHLAALHEAERSYAPLEALPAPPEGWRDEVQLLQAEAIRLSVRREDAERAIRALEDELRQTELDTAALRNTARVEAWRELRSRYDSAVDIPVRQGELAAKREAVADILRRLGRDGEADPRKLMLAAPVVGALEDLIAARSGVLSKLETAGEAAEAAQSAHAQALQALPERSGDRQTAAMASLKARLTEARRDESAARLRAARGEIDATTRRLKEAFAALAPWRGNAEALAQAPVPDEAETAELRRRVAQSEALRRQAADLLAAKTREVERLKVEAAAAASAADGLGDEAAAEVRSAREAAWSAHRLALDQTTASVFEAAMRRDDAVGAARVIGAHELAALRQRRIELAGVETERAHAKADLEKAEKAIGDLDQEIARIAPVAPPKGKDPIAFIDAWRARRSEALTLVEALRRGEDAERRAKDEGERLRERLRAALRAPGVAHDPASDLEALIEAAETALGVEAQLATLRQKAEERRAEAVRAEAKLRSAKEADANWRAAWREACAGTWLGEAAGEPALGGVKQSLKALDELRAALSACAELEDRIAKMERDKRLFADEVAAVAAALDLKNIPDDVRQRVDAIEERVARAGENARRRAEKVEALNEARARLAPILEEIEVNARRASAMTAFFAVATLADVAVKLEDCKRRDLLKAEIAREKAAIIAANVAGSLEAACSLLDQADPAALTAEHAALKARAPHDDQTHAEAHTAHREAVKRLEAVGGDDAVARLEEKRRTILEAVNDGARRYLTLRAGIAAAEEALRLFRDRHRGAMMERASEAFRLVSRGAYRALTTAPNGQSETLIALGADGGSKEAAQLSKGARFQLYLALRVAGYHELAKSRAPAPLVADDIMETFDHFRAEEALRLFADMGRVGQVIYFTHHQHLAELAKAVCPEARVHELAA
ncbi:MAG: AAA family ATPase, partial [Hyphomicrobiales bacterium]|nr:AAA family ATPase [Hyphomicrobiales bacterium]